MKKKTNQPPKPTDAELELLQVLWERGAMTVRQLHEALPKATGYTTTLKILQKMWEKGLVTREESQKSHVYCAALEADRTRRQLVRHLTKSAFGGSAGRLAMQALTDEGATDEELREIRLLLKQLEDRKRTP